MADAATDCDRCHRDIPYGVACYLVPTGRTWDAPDGDAGKPISEVVCSSCYTGPTSGRNPIRAVIQETPRA